MRNKSEDPSVGALLDDVVDQGGGSEKPFLHERDMLDTPEAEQRGVVPHDHRWAMYPADVPGQHAQDSAEKSRNGCADLIFSSRTSRNVIHATPRHTLSCHEVLVIVGAATSRLHFDII